uniref:TPR_REGION domain-containing protein n=2 Tax=Anopheles albimanus TaxID=7167 RepID=A0A182FT99_ANOAL
PDLDPVNVQALPAEQSKDFSQQVKQNARLRQQAKLQAPRPFFPISGQLRALPGVPSPFFQQQVAALPQIPQQQQQQPQQVPAETYGPPEQEEEQPQQQPEQEETPGTTVQPLDNDDDAAAEDEYEDDAGRTVVAISNGFSGQYYILSPDNTLQRVVYSATQTDEDRLVNGFSAQLKYAPVEPIRGPVYTYNEQGQLCACLTKFHGKTMEPAPQKKGLSDEERLKLAAQLDKDLDAFINSLEKKRYTEGWPEDRWEEEMAKHPFFMNRSPEPGEELSPLMEGLQQLKYDPLENTEQELADTYKEDGKFYMQHRKFRMAVLSYTEALRYKVGDAEYKAILYNNRSAANYLLKNYRTSLQDAQKALQLKPDYDKARWRAAQCALALDRFELCIELCDAFLQTNPTDASAIELRKVCVARKQKQQRDERKAAQKVREREAQLQRTCDELRKRAVKFEEPDALTDEQKLRPRLAPLEDFMVSADTDGVLHWPAVFCYPEFHTTDFQQQLSEDTRMDQVLDLLFEEPLECDRQRTYQTSTVAVYYENRILGKAYPVNVTKTIQQIVAEKTFMVFQGTLTFYVVVKGSSHEDSFLNQTRIPLKREF